MRWNVEHLGIEHDGLVIAGVDIWNAEWRPTGELPVTLPHPSYPSQTDSFGIFTAGTDREVTFAACELSNGVWGFYVPIG